jgi:hypothetical protein
MGARPERRARWAVLAGAMALVTGCASDIACSAVGCASGLSVSAPHTVHQQPVRWMKVCVAGLCQTDDLNARHGAPYGDGSVPAAAFRAERTARVTVALESADHTTLMAAGGSVRFRQVAPNGVKCGPVCYIASVAVHPGGTLTAVPIRG